MRKIFVLFCLMIGVIPIIAYTQQVSGTITNLSDKQLILIYTNDHINYIGDTLIASKDGDFNFKIAITKPGFLSIKGDKFSVDDIYTGPGLNIQMVLDANDIYGTRVYKGDQAAINNFYALVEKSAVLKKRGFGRETYNLDPARFLVALDAYFFTRDSLKKEYFKKMDHKEVFLKDFLETDRINMVYFKASALVPYLHQKAQPKEFYEKHLKPLAVQKADEKYLNAANYRDFWANMIDNKLSLIRDSLPPNEAKSALPYYKYIPKLIDEQLSGKLKQIIARRYIETIIRNYGTTTAKEAVVDTALNQLYRLVNNQEYIAKSKTRIEAVKNFKESIKPGVAFRNFKAVDSSGKAYSLADLKGYTVYLDLWASWCGPCVREFKYVNQLLASMPDQKKILYVTISIDESKEKWMEGLRKHKPGGLNLWMPGGFKGELTNYYRVNSIPHYFLIDANHKMITYYAPGPSEDDYLMKLFKTVNGAKQL